MDGLYAGPHTYMHRRYFFFFFQAEDGIRDLTVTGVQTCALPISRKTFCRKESIRSRIAYEMDERKWTCWRGCQVDREASGRETDCTARRCCGGRRLRQCEKLGAFETMDSQGNVGRIRLPAPCISGNCHASITTRWCGQRIPCALARRR